MDGFRVDELDTPCLTVDLDAFEDNVALCMRRLAGVRVRPHLKTAKSPQVAELLLEAGAAGICVAKLSEAEVMIAGGIDDVLITTELVGPMKVRRLAQLAIRWPQARIRVVVDSWEGAGALDAALPHALETLLDVNVGQDRCGVSPEDALALADRIVASSGSSSSGFRGTRATSSTCVTRPSGARSATRRCVVSSLRWAICAPPDTRLTL